MVSIIGELGTTRWRTRRDRVYRAIETHEYTNVESRAAERIHYSRNDRAAR